MELIFHAAPSVYTVKFVFEKMRFLTTSVSGLLYRISLMRAITNVLASTFIVFISKMMRMWKKQDENSFKGRCP